ncbi:MAG: enolase C-terminal domain-like protein [Chloroflexota bacterium]
MGGAGERTGIGEAVLERAADAAELGRLIAWLEARVAAGEVAQDAALEAAGPVGLALLAAFDAARLDLFASPDPVLGPAGAGVGVNALAGGTTPAEVEAAASAAVEAGFRTIKLKALAGDDAVSLAERVRAVRSAVGPDVALRLDVNGTWNLETAIENIAAVEPFGLQYIEQPLPPDDLAGMAGLRRRTGVRIAADEAVRSRAAAKDVLDAGAADVLVVKPARVGGPAVAGWIAGDAAARGVPVVLSSLFETGVGLAAALAAAPRLPDVPGWPAAGRDHGLATADLLATDLLEVPLSIQGGRMRVPGGPGTGGLGIALDEAELVRCLVTR